MPQDADGPHPDAGSGAPSPGDSDRAAPVGEVAGSSGSHVLLPSSPAERRRALEFALAPDAERNSNVIGPYKLLHKIGEGGFGVVWMAEQQYPVRRRVALKVIKSGMDTREVIARFEAERQALALMDHPNIARVFEAGETESGRPFFVMELVRGIPITRYCDENRVPIDTRLRLFIATCHAVQHAHQKGIIHRDLKPSNIIVTMHDTDGVGMPKVIDFGIAKATEVQLTEKTFFTQFHAFIGTPAYTSPEQMEMSGVDVDTRSDIYSLGVLLYELLAGHPPFDPEELLHSGLDGMRRTIREVDPPRPSQRVRTYSDKIRTTVARQRGTDAARLSALLRGDLDGIVMHCLEKDRTRRYETANGLAADVQRFLNDEPVAARPPGTTYRLRKSIRRHKLGFTAGAAVVIAIVAGFIASSVMWIRERDSREREAVARVQADENARQAHISAAKSEQIAHFMKEMLAGVGPSVALGRDTTLLREVLDSTAKRLDAELHDQPEVTADLRDTLGMVYFDLGHYATAEPLLRQAVAARRLLPGGTIPRAVSLENLGVALLSLNKFKECESVLREALAIRRTVHGDEHASVATTLHHLAIVLGLQDRGRESKALHREVLELRRKLLGSEHPDVAESIARLGAHEESLAMRRRLLGDHHPAVADALVGLGNTLPIHEQDRALGVYREAFLIRRNVFGDGHPEVVAALLRFLSALAFQSPLEEAAPVARDIVASTRKNLGNDSVALAPSLLALAALLHGDASHIGEVRALTDEAHALLESSRAVGPQLDAETISAMKEFVHGMVLSGQPARALAMAEEVMASSRAVFGSEHSLTIDAMRPLGRIHLLTGRFDEARALFAESVVGIRRLYGPDHALSLGLLSGLASANRNLGDFAQARKVIEHGLALLPRDDAGGIQADPAIATVLLELGLILDHEKKFEEAERTLREAILHHDRARFDAVFRRIRPRAEIQSALGLTLAHQGRFEEAESLVVPAFADLEANEALQGSVRLAILREARARVAQTYAAWGKAGLAAEWSEKPAERDVVAEHEPR